MTYPLRSSLRPLGRGLLAAGLLLSGCQRVVTLDLNTTASRLTIEGNLADDGQPCTVLLSRSVDYTQPNTFPAVSGAEVTLSDDAGHRETLPETPGTPGQYRGRTVLGQPGRRYTLAVAVAGQTYVAASTLPPVVPLTGLHAVKSGLNTIQVVPDYQDPAGGRNYYLFRQYRNGRLNAAIFLQTDEFTDGKANVRALGGGGGSGGSGRPADADQLATGDSVRVEMQNIDADVYEYFRTFNLTLQGGALATASPANPKSNFSGDVLGYFSAHSRRQRRLIIPAL